MNILIVGCGYVGMALAQLWSCHNLTLTTTSESRRTELEQLGRVVIVKGSEREKIAKLVQEADRIVVTVAPSGGSYEDSYLEAAKSITELTPDGTPILYTSSTSVYGDAEGRWVNEDSPLRGKPILIATESLYSQRPNTTIFRLAGILGPGRDLESFARRFSGKKTCNGYTNFVYLEDIVCAIDWAFTHHLEGVYNLCCSEHPLKSALYDPIVKRLGLEPICWEECPSPFGNKRVSNEKIKKTGFCFTKQL